jgi:hypothetical protein
MPVVVSAFGPPPRYAVALLGWCSWVALMDCPDQLIAVACDYVEILIRQLAPAFLALLPLVLNLICVHSQNLLRIEIKFPTEPTLGLGFCDRVDRYLRRRVPAGQDGG